MFLESAGREDAVTAIGIEGAAGLMQIVAETAVNLLGMRVDVTRARANPADRAGGAPRRDFRGQRLRAGRARVDQRFNPVEAIAGMSRYLRLAKEKFGTDQLAIESYHMGMGNLETVLRLYAEDSSERPIAEIVDERELALAQVYFDSSPLRHADVHDKLASLGDDSSNYLWKILAARDMMRTWRRTPGCLRQSQEASHGQELRRGGPAPARRDACLR